MGGNQEYGKTRATTEGATVDGRSDIILCLQSNIYISDFFEDVQNCI
jgi:hypothetical protein